MDFERKMWAKRLGAAVLQWHGGQGTWLYSVGSRMYAGIEPSREDIENAIGELPSTGRGVKTLAKYMKKFARGVVKQNPSTGDKNQKLLARIENLFANMPTPASSRAQFDGWVHAATLAEQAARRAGIPSAERRAAEARGKARFPGNKNPIVIGPSSGGNLEPVDVEWQRRSIGNPSRSGKKAKVVELEEASGLCVATWSPGDGVTRYRFFRPKPGGCDYFADEPLYTALGFKEAMAYARGARHARGNPRGNKNPMGGNAHSVAASHGYPFLRGDGRADRQGNWFSRFTKTADGTGPALFVGLVNGKWKVTKYAATRGWEKKRNPSRAGLRAFFTANYNRAARKGNTASMRKWQQKLAHLDAHPNPVSARDLVMDGITGAQAKLDALKNLVALTPPSGDAAPQANPRIPYKLYAAVKRARGDSPAPRPGFTHVSASRSQLRATIAEFKSTHPKLAKQLSRYLGNKNPSWRQNFKYTNAQATRFMKTAASPLSGRALNGVLPPAAGQASMDAAYFRPDSNVRRNPSSVRVGATYRDPVTGASWQVVKVTKTHVHVFNPGMTRPLLVTRAGFRKWTGVAVSNKNPRKRSHGNAAWWCVRVYSGGKVISKQIARATPVQARASATKLAKRHGKVSLEGPYKNKPSA